MRLSLPSALMLLGGLGLLVFGLRGLDAAHGTFGGRFASQVASSATPTPGPASAASSGAGASVQQATV